MKIGIEPNLTNIKNYLESQGCSCSTITKPSTTNFNTFDAIIITGQSDNILGIEDTETTTRIIDADGLTPQEVYNQIKTIIE
jgi:hypothetical protein